MHRKINRFSNYLTTVLFLFILLSVIVTAFSFNRINKRDSELIISIRDKDNILNNYNNYMDDCRIREHYQFVYSEYYTDMDFILYNEKDEKILINNILDKELSPVMVLKYNELNCNSCVVSEIKLIQDIFGLNNNCIKIFSSYTNITDLFHFKRDNEIKYELFNLKDKKLIKEIDDLQRPFVFLLSSGGLMTKLFIPTKDNQELSVMYYQYIRDYLSKF